jgi:uncharacterized repeat protein (TIGR03803 family)
MNCQPRKIMPRKTLLLKRSVTLVLLVFGALLCAASAQTESVLYSFCAQKNCTDGAIPGAGVVFDQKGNLYGTTYAGGAHDSTVCDPYIPGCGVVFELTPEGRVIVLYSFCAQNNCSDGAVPGGGLIFDQNGNMYGTTEGGGAYGGGTVSKLTPKGKETVLYSFCAQKNCTDGARPDAGLVFDQKGNMYGTTYAGGAHNDCHGGAGCGIVFKLTPKGRYTVLYSFCAQTNCADGYFPSGGLVFDQEGNLYGTTLNGGAHDWGTVFKLTPEGKETVLHSFCSHGGSNCTDGALPDAGVIFDQKGNLYGTTYSGGTSCHDGYDNGCGVVFKLTPKGKETVLYSFCAQSGCADGAFPAAGTTGGGGDYCDNNYLGCGVVFELSPEGKEKVLHTFEGADGAVPGAGVVFDQKGNLYGTSVGGGAYNDCYEDNAGCGVVFKLTP